MSNLSSQTQPQISDSAAQVRRTTPINGGRLVMTSVRLDRNLHQALRKIAFDRRKSLHSLLIEGAQAVCKRYTEMSAPDTAAE
jgi:hypothetical protein